VDTAAALTEQGNLPYVIGSVLDEYVAAAPERRVHALTSLIPRYDSIVVAAIAGYLDNGTVDREHEWSIADGAMDYTRSGTELSGNHDEWTARASEEFTTGEPVAPSIPSGDLLPVPGSYNQQIATVTDDETTCAYEGPRGVPIGTVLDIGFVNDGRVPAVVLVGDR